jgi:hypothetical protein
MRKKRLRVRLLMVRGTMAKIKIGIYSERKAPDSGSEGRNRRDTWRADARGTCERKGDPTLGCVDRRA